MNSTDFQFTPLEAAHSLQQGPCWSHGAVGGFWPTAVPAPRSFASACGRQGVAQCGASSCARQTRCISLQPTQFVQERAEYPESSSVREISHHLSRITEELSSIKNLSEQVRALRKEVEVMTEAIDSVSKATYECKIKVDETDGKLENVIRGLSDFTADVHTWMHGDGEEEPTKANALEDSASGAGTAELSPKALDWMQYIDTAGVGLTFD
ncbi:hypothetical protein Micbo1qcDRAFT_198919 [Microdochium bolleyi]|uniref:Uncharacterized protein n=1 Tax=Microdochium bolleyi TaxID=196109 RepID=A0A136IJP2_9PEZI|nr:hypothetical protein Micbo1qcDRAFT_198919 [Microdochium bolleyi]